MTVADFNGCDLIANPADTPNHVIAHHDRYSEAVSAAKEKAEEVERAENVKRTPVSVSVLADLYQSQLYLTRAIETAKMEQPR